MCHSRITFAQFAIYRAERRSQLHVGRNGLTLNMHKDAYAPDPTRFRIVEALAGGEQAVGDLVRAVDIDQSGVSRHLRIFGEAGFVAMRPDGARRLYSLRPEPFRAIDDWIPSYRKLWEGRLDRFDAALARQQSLRQPEEKT